MTQLEKQLPEFENPPLNEVVLGVQFRQPLNYQQIQAFEVWNLFRDKFPVVQEQMPLPPQFETFGLPVGGQISFSLVESALPNRYWFLTSGGEQLLQFQQDRLLHNWRKVGDGTNQYPRFEGIIDSFSKEMVSIEDYFKRNGNERLFITQAEISYINQIQLPPAGSVVLQDWLSVFSDDAPAVDDLSYNAKTVLHSSDDQPVSRLYRESGIGIVPGKGRVLTLSLTIRGKPQNDTVSGALEFISSGREAIADEFLKITTSKAQNIWKRTQ